MRSIITYLARLLSTDRTVGQQQPAGRLRSQARRAGLALSAAGIGTVAWGTLAAAPAAVTLPTQLVSTGAPCGAGELCIKPSQVPTTATAFSGGSCGDLVSAHPDEDLWHFVIPSGASFDTDTSHFTAIFTSPDGSVHAGSIGGPDDEFAFVYSPAGATLAWAFATNVSGTPVQDYFVLSGTCPASQSSTTTSTSSTTTTTTTTSTTSTTRSSTTTASSTTSTTSSPTGSVSGTTTTPDGSTSSNSTSTGGVQGIAVTTPNTGAGGGYAVLVGLVLLGGGSALLGVGGRRRRSR